MRIAGIAMKRWLHVIAVAALIGMLVVASGIMPIKASSRHWAITAWFLNFAMERSVSTYTLGIQPNSQDDAWLIFKGARHYELACSPCHGNPGMRHPQITQAMTPPPPYLAPEIHEWQPEELFYIVKHGVKFTGMPAWPSQSRDDEVWAVVAFLQKLPELSIEEYRKITGSRSRSHNYPNAPSVVNTNCSRCHVDNRSQAGAAAFPILAGQKPAYLLASLQSFSSQNRHSGIMGPIAQTLTAGEMRAIAQYYSNLPRRASPPNASVSDAIRRGKTIASRGIPERRVPACAACHGPEEKEKNPVYPLLTGQHSEYLILQLRLFKQDRRGGTKYAHLMRRVANALTEEQIHDVALYYASLSPKASNTARESPSQTGR